MPGRLTRAELLAAEWDDLTEWQQAWRAYFVRNPNVVAAWGYANERWPNDIDEEI